ncbi:DNA-binding MarR family transcriptional regulator [Leucobacter luti]|uniref:DNA-binding MarR family transcriptional regulator n=2 Tax=Leucobacter luti TaxID=340320 RepID=A0A4R6RWL9_9MICO|nr:DNA-binding MarR family transcriptional regulator [Leucobacter luti]
MYMYDYMHIIPCQVTCKIDPMTATNSAPHSAGTEPEDPNASQASETHPASEADAIVAALSRIRGRGFRGPGGHGRRNHDGAAARDSFGSDWSGHSGSPGFAGHPGHPGHPGFPGPTGEERGPRGRFGGPALLRLLGQLAHADSALSVSELAERIGVDQPRASRLVQQAVEREFAAREADPADARRTRVRLTDAGRRAVHGFRGQQRADMTVALDALTAPERGELARLITKLADAWPEP